MTIWMKIVFFCIVFVACVLAQERKHIEFTQRRTLTNGWTLKEDAQPSTILKLTFALKLRNEAELKSHFWRVSDPYSSEYTNYLSLDEIIEKYSAHDEDITTLVYWLKPFSLLPLQMPKTRDFIIVTVNVSTAEKLLGVNFQIFEHESHPSIIRTLDPYSLPVEIAKVVSFVTGINRFPSLRNIHLRKKQRSILQSNITPQVIWKTFNTGGLNGKNPKNLQAVAQFLHQYYDPSDLSQFQKAFNLPTQQVSKEIGPNDPTNPGIEASLDIEYIMGVAPNISTWFWSTGGEHEGQEPFVQWAIDMNNSPTVPFVTSVSYGDDENSISKDFADALNVQFQKLALRGVSVLFASGDDGVGCTQNCVHSPNWPASSPYVTTVGGFVGPSRLVGDGISSGGFSNLYEMPSYQKEAVTRYLSNSNNLPPKSQYNATSRAMPDVSSFSENVVVVQFGNEIGVGGTSCASPVFAAIISLINDALLSSGKKTLGFLNQALYTIGKNNENAFLDVLIGSNGSGCCKGFTASKGWDPITGFGGPNFPELSKSLQNLQNK